jgi:DnaJ-class molecular chaperone
MNSSDKENFYDLLGISETANAEEIKKAYRKLSLKYHPDKNNGDPECVSKFQKISEAYETLGNAEKKSQYDMMQKNPFARMSSMHGGMPGMPFDNMDDLFTNIFFGGGGPFGMHGMPGMPGMPGMFPGGPNIKIFRNGVPVNFAGGLEKPTPIIKTIVINMDTVLNGGKIPLEIERWIVENGNKVFENQTVYVDVMKGVDNNEIITLINKGNSYVNNGVTHSNVKIIIVLKPHDLFERNGLDIIYIKTISLKEALLGFSFVLNHINNKNYNITCTEIIHFNYEKIKTSMGFVRDNFVGNLIIKFNIIFPSSLSLDVKKQLEPLL